MTVRLARSNVTTALPDATSTATVRRVRSIVTTVRRGGVTTATTALRAVTSIVTVHRVRSIGTTATVRRAATSTAIATVRPVRSIVMTVRRVATTVTTVLRVRSIATTAPPVASSVTTAPPPRLRPPGLPRQRAPPVVVLPRQGRAPPLHPEDDVVLERLEAEAIQADAVEGIGFGDLGLGGNIVRALKELGAESPFPIQAATIPQVLEGRDVLGRGRTGSGKTIAFGAPTVERLMQLWSASDKAGGKRVMGRAPRALVLAPTRELALQIDRTVQPIAQSVGLFTTQVYGGVPQARQVGALRRGVDIVIGTPGRIEDLVRQGHLDLSEIEITVLDEADHMCDLGFLEPVQRILRETKEGGQKLLFSATLDSGVAMLVDEFLVNPAVHEVAGEDQASGTIEHRVFVIDNRDKRDIVAMLADRDGKTLVFSRTRAFAEDLTEHLEDAGIRAVALHGDLNQSRRTRNLHQLTSGRVDVLVATDVAARGIHVDDIDLVIQADAPDEYKTYLHRSGRTGRAGAAGRVVTLIPRNRQRRMAELLDRAEIDVDFEDVQIGDAVLYDLGPIDVEAPVAAADADESTEA
ncbi:DEAD/DEAH box helicase [Agromyces protaetiae]|uniref:DEAD/DEAH box helicase n=1 Tax=Agromyces protaetiae TaxID=2509455 RepID=UPI00312C9F18